MRKFFAILFISVSSITLTAQITINNNTFYQAGDTLRTVNDAFPPNSLIINPSSGTIGAYWDFQGLSGMNSITVYDDAINGMNFSNFPNADLVINSLTGENYYSVSSSKIEQIGYQSPDPLGLGFSFPVVFSPALTERKAPLNFSDSYSDDGSAIIPIPMSIIPQAVLDLLPITPDTLRMVVDYERTNDVDGWGTIQIPNGTFYTLREKRVETRSTKIEAGIEVFGSLIWQDISTFLPFGDLGNDTTTVYNFYGDSTKEFLAKVEVDNSNLDDIQSAEFVVANGDTVPDTTTIIPNSIQVLFDYEGLEVSPNPCSNVCKLSILDDHLKNISIELFNIKGEKVFKESYINSSNILLNVSSIASGTYIINLKDEDDKIIAIKKLMIE